MWISSLYINPEYKNSNWGYTLLDFTIEHISLQKVKNIYLDCNIDGNFLENYYIRYGFTKLSEKYFKFPKIQFNASLMILNKKKE